ncbi:CynX/NimT family MFS transporter [Castellaniella sp.]|uniref:CynX/NimT family MFS transporter n=1 Tax=Castellaniella sp. TaxID=1955812 RepID=UPI00355CA85B
MPRNGPWTLWFAAIGLLLLAANLRSLFASLSVLLPEIIQGLGLSGAQAGYLTTLPVLCMGLFAPFAPRCAARIGMERSLWLVLLMIFVGTLLRAQLGIEGLFAGTALAGAGIALGNVLLPSLVKRDFSAHAALMTGLYTMSLCGGAALASAATLPLIDYFGQGWRFGLSLWAIPAAIALLAWIPLALRSAHGKSAGSHRLLPVRGLKRDPLAWAVTVFMGLQSALAYCVLGWMAPILRARGLDGTEAGLITSVSILVQVVACLLAPALAARSRDQRLLAVALTALATLPLIGMVSGPIELAWFLAILQGLGQGGLFALALMLIVMRSSDSHVAAYLSSMSQTVGYVLASSGPLFIGFLHDFTGNFDSVWILLTALGLLATAAGWLAGSNRLVKAETLHPGR